MTRYLTYDVFTDSPFGGNPLAVIPDARALPEDSLQKIAREFNYSETVFIYPPRDGAHTARLRIFTPTMEIPFAGHPTIGAAIALAQTGHGPEMILELGVGPLKARASEVEASFTTSASLEIIARPAPAFVARALGLPESALAAPPVLASVGLPFTLTELTSRAALAACRPDVPAFREGAALFDASLDFAQFAYVRRGAQIDARMFAPLDNIPEDPATGSASAALGAYLASQEGPLTLAITQGEDMGRPSRIGVASDGKSVTISGQARRMMEGQFAL